MRNHAPMDGMALTRGLANLFMAPSSIIVTTTAMLLMPLATSGMVSASFVCILKRRLRSMATSIAEIGSKGLNDVGFLRWTCVMHWSLPMSSVGGERELGCAG